MVEQLGRRFLRTPEASAYLGLSRRTLEKHRTYGTGPTYRKLGGRVVYDLADLSRWADEGLRVSTSDGRSATAAPTYRALDPTRTWYLTSTSKSLSPLMRVGILIPPQNHYGAAATRLRAEVWGAAPVAVELACALIDLGVAERVFKALRTEARERVRLAADMLQITPLMPEGAAHIWLPMRLADAERLVRRAAEAGVRLTPPNATAVSEEVAGVRLCLMAPTRRSDLVRALRVVSDLRATALDPIV